MRFLGLGLGERMLDAKTIWLFREHLTQTKAVENLFARFDKHHTRSGYLAMSGQIVDATIVAREERYVSDIHHKKPKGRPMSEATSRANGRRSRIRAFVEHVFAQSKSCMGLFVRTIGLARARTKIEMANVAYNLTRFVRHQG